MRVSAGEHRLESAQCAVSPRQPVEHGISVDASSGRELQALADGCGGFIEAAGEAGGDRHGGPVVARGGAEGLRDRFGRWIGCELIEDHAHAPIGVGGVTPGVDDAVLTVVGLLGESTLYSCGEEGVPAEHERVGEVLLVGKEGANVVDVAGGDKVPRKGGPGITQSDLLVINKTDLAPHVGADLGVMARDAAKMRGEGPVVFSQVVRGVGVDEIVEHILRTREKALGRAAAARS